MTAFHLPQGRFYYMVAPMGLNPSGDWWCRKSDEAIAGLPGFLKLVDDILVHATSLVELRGRIRGVLQRCRAHGIVLSKKKFEIGRSVHFAGHNVTDGGIKPDEERLEPSASSPPRRTPTSCAASSALPTSWGTSSLIWRRGQSR